MTRALAIGLTASAVLAAAALATVVAAITFSAPEFPPRPGFLRSTCPPAEDPEHFFHPSAFITAEWAALPLAAMKLPSLSCGPGDGAERYRFLWLRAFHGPIAVQVTRRDQTATLVAVELEPTRLPLFRIGEIVRRVERPLSDAEWASWLWHAREAGMLDPRPPSPADELGLDGSEWIVEVRRGDAYRVERRFAPHPGVFRDACLLLIRLSGLPVPESEIY